MAETKVDRDWFRARLDGIKMSQRTLAKNLGLDPAAVTLMLRGERRLTTEEAQKISILFGVPVTEVIRRAGVEVHDDVRKVRICGYLNSDAIVECFGDDANMDYFESPADVPAGSYALQVRDHMSPHDGWVMVVSSEKVGPEKVLDRACACQTEDGALRVGVIKKGYKRGAFNLVVTATKPQIVENASIEWASPILWIKPF